MSEAAHVDIGIDQGADFGMSIYWTDGASVPFKVLAPMRMDIKAETGQVVHSCITGVTTGGNVSTLLYNPDSGLIQISIPNEATAQFPAGSYEYDLFVSYEDSKVTNEVRMHRLLTGRVHVYRRVTETV